MIALSVKVTSNLHSVELPVRVRTEALANAADLTACQKSIFKLNSTNSTIRTKVNLIC